MLEVFESRIVQSNLVTVDEKWFYCRHLRPKNMIGSWVLPGGDQIQTARRTPMDKKFMAIVAVSLRGLHYFEVLPRNQCVDSTVYIEFLNKMFISFGDDLQRHPIRTRNMSLIHDNARPHVSQATSAYLSGKGVRLLKQPPYSPDCNLCDRYIFPRLEALRKNNYETKEELEEFLSQHLPTFNGERMKDAYEDMCKDFRDILDKGGDYL
jgi:hypothetical protein